jgi:hypothetical protein
MNPFSVVGNGCQRRFVRLHMTTLRKRRCYAIERMLLENIGMENGEVSAALM